MAVCYSVTVLGAVSISSRTVGFWGRRGGETGQAREVERRVFFDVHGTVHH